MLLPTEVCVYILKSLENLLCSPRHIYSIKNTVILLGILLFFIFFYFYRFKSLIYSRDCKAEFKGMELLLLKNFY